MICSSCGMVYDDDELSQWACPFCGDVDEPGCPGDRFEFMDDLEYAAEFFPGPALPDWRYGRISRTMEGDRIMLGAPGKEAYCMFRNKILKGTVRDVLFSSGHYFIMLDSGIFSDLFGFTLHDVLAALAVEAGSGPVVLAAGGRSGDPESEDGATEMLVESQWDMQSGRDADAYFFHDGTFYRHRLRLLAWDGRSLRAAFTLGHGPDRHELTPLFGITTEQLGNAVRLACEEFDFSQQEFPDDETGMDNPFSDEDIPF